MWYCCYHPLLNLLLLYNGFIIFSIFSYVAHLAQQLYIFGILLSCSVSEGGGTRTTFPAGSFCSTLLLRCSVSHQYLFYCDFHLLWHLPHFSDYVTRKLLTDKIISNRCVPRVICVRVYVL